MVKSAEAGAEAVRERVSQAIEEARPITVELLREIRAELSSVTTAST